MSTKGGTMTTRAQTVVQVQNLKIHNKGGAAKARTDGSKAQQKPGVGIRKALANITNSEKPYFQKESKKDQLKKCANKEVPIVIGEEQCQHNHQSCVSLTETSTKQLLDQILPLDDEKVGTEDVSTNGGTMTARTRTLVQVQNLNIHNKGGTAKAQANGSKAQQQPHVGIRKALANITNSEKPYFHKESKKNQLKKHANKEVPLVIEEELCQHNHQCCMSLQSETSTNHLLNQILPLDDEKSSLELWSPKTPSTILNQSKVYFESTPKYLNFTQSPVSLKY
ncbi:hypothetical protein CKAN_00305400 [Cinnamomum micranthum f. kanehirae]|uniref:Uncharacterized protein n=1 Tax=Cinnamomum micranthum f. kanehirae TaxID=337451 RepID=A0A443N868_9MAGN|nr:hypothetical protein CKAN_00305400 [Cinnamomum micranthum f. kanehirae]